MPGLLQNVIVSAEPDSATQTVRLAWQNGSVTWADFAPVAERGVFRALADLVFFRPLEVRDDGHVLAWPGELEFEADALWFEARPKDSPTESAGRQAAVPQ